MIGCDNCEAVYIGESDNVNRRRYQHSRSLIFSDENSSIVRHDEEMHHHVNLDKTNIIYKTCNVSLRLCMESYLIKNKNNFNLIPGTVNLDHVSNKLLQMSNLGRRIDKNFDLCLAEWNPPGGRSGFGAGVN